ncbi:MAG: hypothetical protein OFPI_15770 [Osedax symbiont Rs2]|nr:MAG: hypothetical protein OFPI_15770 [Osedax symbiont Rs2]
MALQWNWTILAAPIGSAGIFLTAVESRACAMWCSEVTDSGVSKQKMQRQYKQPIIN